jgi:hypothetical protein
VFGKGLNLKQNFRVRDRLLQFLLEFGDARVEFLAHFPRDAMAFLGCRRASG